MAKYRRLGSSLPTRQWFSAPTRRVHKVNRNSPCTCGSGKKYKKCCGFQTLTFWEKLTKWFRKKPKPKQAQ